MPNIRKIAIFLINNGNMKDNVKIFIDIVKI